MNEQHKQTSHGPAYDTQPAGLEKWADETFNTKNPVQLPQGFRKWLADNVWWLTLAGGVLTLLAVLSSWQAMQTINNYSVVVDDLARSYGVPGTSASAYNWAWYGSLLASVVMGVLYLMAFQKLKEKRKSGWNLVYYASLISLVMGVLYALTPVYGLPSLIFVAIGVAIGWTLLFQVRKYFAH